MGSEEIIEIIETICGKLGIAINSFSDFVPELAKYKISTSAFWVSASALVILLSAFLIVYIVKRAEKMIRENPKVFSYGCVSDFASVWAISIVCGFLVLVFLFVFLCNARNIVSWVASPQASAVDYMLNFL